MFAVTNQVLKLLLTSGHFTELTVNCFEGTISYRRNYPYNPRQLGLLKHAQTHVADAVTKQISKSEERIRRSPASRTDHVFKPVTWRQRVISFSTLLTSLGGDDRL